MRVAFYNQMFGLNGRKLFSNIIGHYSVHFRNNRKKILKRMDINRTVEVVRKIDADVIGIAEVLEHQECDLRENLQRMGYKSIYFEKGHRTKFRKMHVKIVIASRADCKKIHIKGFPYENKMGGGGGIVGCYSLKYKLNLISVHLALTNKEIYSKQIIFLKKYIADLKDNVVLFGDFNSTADSLKEDFSNLKLVSNGARTCSLTPVLRRFYYKDIDHIFVKGINVSNFGDLEGYSDHKLVYADLEHN
jgi:endonuclease/exonuclease/phosphatase family metal-dependent hydrolase